MWYFSLDSVPISRNFFFCEIEKNKSKGEQQNSFSWKVRSSFFFLLNSFFSHKFQFCHGKSFYCKTSSQSFTDLLLLTFLKNAFGFSDQVSHFCSVTNSISKQLQIQDEKHSEIDSEFLHEKYWKKRKEISSFLGKIHLCLTTTILRCNLIYRNFSRLGSQLTSGFIRSKPRTPIRMVYWRPKRWHSTWKSTC